MTDMLIAGYLSAAPGIPTEAALARVRDRARTAAAARARSRSAPMRLRILMAAAVAAAVLGVGAFVLMPRVDDSAFARRAASAALLPRGSVLHTRATWTEERWFAKQGAWPTRTSVLEDWADAERMAVRTQFRSADSTELTEVSVRLGTVERSLGRDGGYDEKTHAFVAGQWRLVQYDAPADFTSSGLALVDQLRDGLERGTAKVVGKQTIDGTGYWIVEMTSDAKDPATGTSRRTIRAVMRERDYALREIAMRGESDHPVDGKSTESLALRFGVWETIDRKSLPDGFFALSQVDEAAPPGTIVEAPALRPGQ